MEFSSLDRQRESGEFYPRSQGWTVATNRYDDGGVTGGNVERPTLKRLLADIEAGKVDVVVVYKVDRLSRSLLDFGRLMELFTKHNVAFVSVTQQIDTSTSMGRLMLNVLLSFAQFERELVSERTRDKIAATRKKGKYAGGRPILGYDTRDTKLVVNAEEAERVQAIFQLYLDHRSMITVVNELMARGWKNKGWTTRKGTVLEPKPFDKNSLIHPERTAVLVIDPEEMTEALRQFAPVWETLTPQEQTRVVELLVARVDYDGKTGNVVVTFNPTGILGLEVAA